MKMRQMRHILLLFMLNMRKLQPLNLLALILQRLR
jgi:hypothetical protein